MSDFGSAAGMTGDQITAAVDDLFSDVGGDTGEETPETLVEASGETALEDLPEIPESVEPEPVKVDVKTEPPVDKPVDTLAEVPEGCKEFTKGDRQYWTYEKSRGQEIYSGYRVAKDLEQVVGGPVTIEAVQQHVDKSVTFDRLAADASSGNPEDQRKAFGFLMQEAARAQEAGEVDGDPISSGFDVHMKLVGKYRPDIMERIGTEVLRDTLDGMYAEAKASGNKALFTAAQHLDNARFKAYQKWDTYQPPAKVDDREANLRAREERLERDARASAERAWTEFSRATVSANETAVQSQIGAFLKPHEAKFGRFPEQLTNVRVRMEQEIQKAMEADKNFQHLNSIDMRSARATRSDAVRSAALDRIKGRYEQKAKLVSERVGRGIISDVSGFIAESSAAKHGRLKEASEQTRVGAGKPAGATISNGAPAGGLSKADFLKELSAL